MPGRFFEGGTDSTAGFEFWTVQQNGGTATSDATTNYTPPRSINLTTGAAGQYSGSVRIDAAGATNAPLTVPVALTIN